MRTAVGFSAALLNAKSQSDSITHDTHGQLFPSFLPSCFALAGPRVPDSTHTQDSGAQPARSMEHVSSQFTGLFKSLGHSRGSKNELPSGAAEAAPEAAPDAGAPAQARSEEQHNAAVVKQQDTTKAQPTAVRVLWSDSAGIRRCR